MKIQANKKSGFTLVEIMIVVAIIGLLAAIAIPNFVKARTTSQMNICINNLSKINGAINQWAIEHGQNTGASLMSTDIQPYLGRGVAGELPYCPTDPAQTCNTSYTVGQGGGFVVGLVPVCFIQPGTHICP